ncbi:nucleoside permease [Flavobacterium terrigena]|uniref:MFS transporter, NHS family, xanthosine permease n=1 Tax=Flavobacterium terrigena TaxID=402734 RepID=A0A1H6SS87_9FLAO|nr:nucleoside permease [Flavobacterium terrigena]SEI66462.1 MFS transporter, NHS family, xanthosine permease [Flavobacterium terrigena]
MNIKLKLTIVSFLQLFVWGAWLTTLASYGFGFKQWSGAEFGIVFSTLGLGSIIMPPISGIIADKYLNLEKLYGIHHILYGVILLFLPAIDSPSTFFWVLLIGMMFYMPTLSLSNSLSYAVLKKFNFNVIKDYPPIRVWGTIGFIVAMWCTNIFSNVNPPFSFGIGIGKTIASITNMPVECNQFYIASFFAFALGIFSFTLPKIEPTKDESTNKTLSQIFGLDAFKLFKQSKMAMFFVFSMFLGAALQLTNMYGETYIHDFKNVPEYANTFVVKSANIVLSISQISETIFILAIPFFLRRYGIKKVMLFSLIAWVFRFGFFAYGDPIGSLWMIIMSNIVYGLAFDFFNISGSLFVETTTDSKIRSSAQGLFMMMTNGFGAILGSLGSGFLIDTYFTTPEGKDWHNIWLTFAIYALIITVAFAVLFKHKHDPKDVEAFNH